MSDIDKIRASVEAHPEDGLDSETARLLLARLDYAETGWAKTEQHARSVARRGDRAEARIYAAQVLLSAAILHGSTEERELAQRIRRALESVPPPSA